MLSSSAPLNASLARRLAEAADGLRDGMFYYFVCKTSFPFDLHSVQGSSDQAASDEGDNLKEQLGIGYEKFGPYQTSTENSNPWDYDSMELRFIKNGNAVHTETLEKDIDAIIITMSAYEKFLDPYYARLYGSDVAATFKQAAQEALTSTTFKPVSKHPGRTIQLVGDNSIEQ